MYATLSIVEYAMNGTCIQKMDMVTRGEWPVTVSETNIMLNILTGIILTELIILLTWNGVCHQTHVNRSA